MSALDPSGPPQPTKEQGYETYSNPVKKTPAERAAAQSSQSNDANTVDQRVPTDQPSSTDEAKPTSLGWGVRGAGPGEEAYGKSEEDVGRHRELDAEQMAPPGEGRVAQAVEGRFRSGGSGQEGDFASDLDKKKAEQAPHREAIKQEHERNVDVGGALGQTGGPANPVD